MPEHAHLATDSRRVAPQVMAENHSLPVGDGQQAGAGAQHARLPGPVGPLENHDLTREDREVDAGQSWESPGQSDSGTEEDCGGHGQAPMLRVARPRNPSGGTSQEPVLSSR